MVKIIILFFLIISLSFTKEIKLYKWTHDKIDGKIKIKKIKDNRKIYVEGIGNFSYDMEDKEYKTEILIDTISKNYEIIDIFSLDLNFDLDQEICLILKKEDKNYIKIYHYSFEDNKFYDFLSDDQKKELQNIFLVNKNLTKAKLKKYLNTKIPFVESEYQWFISDLEKNFLKKINTESLNIQNLKFLKYDASERFIYVDNQKNYYYFKATNSRNIISLIGIFEGEIDEDYDCINGVEYVVLDSYDSNQSIRKRVWLNKKVIKETCIIEANEKISKEIFYDLETSKMKETNIYRNGLLSKKITYAYLNKGIQYNYDDFKQVKNFYKDHNGDFKERYKTEFKELDTSKGQLLFESYANKIYRIYNYKKKNWCYILMEKYKKEGEYFYVREIFYGTSDVNLKNGVKDIVKNGYEEVYSEPYAVSLDSWSNIEEKGYYKNNKKEGTWIFNYLHQMYSKVYYIKGVPVCYWDYDADDNLIEFGIYIYSKKIKLKRNHYFYGMSD